MCKINRQHVRLLAWMITVLGCGVFISTACNSSSNQSNSTSTLESSGEQLTPLIDSNTNWLLTCSADSDCDVGEHCACGSCVIPCAPEGNEGARCMTAMNFSSSESISCAIAEPVSEVSSCGEDYIRPHEGICLLGCQSDEECPDHLLCHEGQCKRPRRGESRGCDDERECIEAGGDPMRCHVLCDDDPENQMGPPPPPLMEEIDECERRCTSEGNEAPQCRTRCAVCAERCLLTSDLEEAERCAERCAPEDDDDDLEFDRDDDDAENDRSEMDDHEHDDED